MQLFRPCMTNCREGTFFPVICTTLPQVPYRIFQLDKPILPRTSLPLFSQLQTNPPSCYVNWLIAGPGKGISDSRFLIVESRETRPQVTWAAEGGESHDGTWQFDHLQGTYDIVHDRDRLRFSLIIRDFILVRSKILSS